MQTFAQLTKQLTVEEIRAKFLDSTLLPLFDMQYEAQKRTEGKGRLFLFIGLHHAYLGDRGKQIMYILAWMFFRLIGLMWFGVSALFIKVSIQKANEKIAYAIYMKLAAQLQGEKNRKIKELEANKVANG